MSSDAFAQPCGHVGFVEFACGDPEHQIGGVIGGDFELEAVEDAEHGE